MCYLYVSEKFSCRTYTKKTSATVFFERKIFYKRESNCIPLFDFLDRSIQVCFLSITSSTICIETLQTFLLVLIICFERNLNLCIDKLHSELSKKSIFSHVN